jgi:hypothetical protein
VQIAFPNGSVLKQSTAADSQGLAHVDFKQAASLITHENRTAQVTVSEAQDVAGMPATETYTIGFARIDVAVEPAAVGRGERFTVWVHTAARSTVLVELRPSRSRSDSAAARTGPKGWAHLRFRVEESRKPGASLVVRATLTGSAHPASTRARIKVT